MNVRNGLSDILAKIEQLPAEEQEPLKHDIEGALAQAAALAMVNSDKGITNLHFPNDVIVDASMPAMIRNGGKMWNAKGGSTRYFWLYCPIALMRVSTK